MIINTKNNNRVVIAEDSPTQAEKLIFSLENLGLEVSHAPNGKLALDLIRKIGPAMIISDVVMPEMNGYELCRTVREDADLHSIPIILLTSLSETEDILKGLEAGADSYIMKPFNEQYLKSRLNQIMENKELLAKKRREKVIDVGYEGKNYKIGSSAVQILNLLFSSYESAIYKNAELEDQEKELKGMNEILRKKVENRKQELNNELQHIIEAEEQLKESEEEFRDLVDNALIGIYIAKMDGTIELCNEALLDILEFESAGELLQTDVRKLFEDPNDRDRMLDILKKEQSLSEFETKLKTKQGKSKDVMMNTSLEGKFITAMILDITEQKEAEMRMKDYAGQLLDAKQKAEQSENLKTAFLANMSNEIINPLNSLLGFTELIGKDKISRENINDYNDQINQSGNQLINIIENIIDLAKIESGELNINLSDCNINKMLLDLYAEHREALEKREKSSIEFILKRENKDIDFSFITEAYRLKSIIDNLLSNAIKYTDEGVIEFGYTVQYGREQENNNQIQFFVKDTGRGIEGEKLQWLFDRFRKADIKYKKMSDGAGLGLTLTKAYVELLGGKIWCKSEPGKGSEFYFILPFNQSSEIHLSDKKISPSLNGNLKPNLKILVAEDITSNYLLLEALMEEIKPELIWAKNGQEAVELFKKEQDIDVILMDLRMPVMSGSEAIAEIRKMNKSIPIIVQTAFAREEDKDNILELGCNSFITKPIRREILFREIEGLMHLK